MTKKELEFVQQCVDGEGFDYTFLHYSNFNQIKDAKFHKLRKAFVKSAEVLSQYLKLDEE